MVIFLKPSQDLMPGKSLQLKENQIVVHLGLFTLAVNFFD
jgi:hypothetical protein